MSLIAFLLAFACAFYAGYWHGRLVELRSNAALLDLLLGEELAPEDR